MVFNIGNLVKKHFGLDVLHSTKTRNYGDISVNEAVKNMVNGLPVEKYSLMGTPVYDYIKVEAGNYYDWNGDHHNYDAYDFPFECVVELSQPTIMEETYLKGRRSGSVKEIIGLDDFYITIRGFIINYKTSEYPTKAVEAFKRLIKLPTELQIESPFLNMFDINEMVILDRNIPQIEGSLHYQPFTLMCKSNEPYILEL